MLMLLKKKNTHTQKGIDKKHKLLILTRGNNPDGFAAYRLQGGGWIIFPLDLLRFLVKNKR